jgi:hypothetical protein
MWQGIYCRGEPTTPVFGVPLSPLLSKTFLMVTRVLLDALSDGDAEVRRVPPTLCASWSRSFPGQKMLPDS